MTCGDSFTYNHVLQYVPIGAVALTSGFTNGAGQIWLDQVACRGTETRLIDCPANPLGTHDCSHIEDVGVRCVTRENTLLPQKFCLSSMHAAI